MINEDKEQVAEDIEMRFSTIKAKIKESNDKLLKEFNEIKDQCQNDVRAILRGRARDKADWVF